MAALRKASAYSKKRVRPYTRKSGKKSQAYIKTVPPLRIVKFNMGDRKGFNEKKYPFVVSLITEEKAQMRDNSLEACRMFVNKALDTFLPASYYFLVKAYPHHILRENKTAAGAGADRLSSGMKHSFGVTIGRAAIVPPGKDIFAIYVANDKAVRIAREALQKIKSKIPFRSKIILEKEE
jgi:large subunit ribosomal protein L10e